MSMEPKPLQSAVHQFKLPVTDADLITLQIHTDDYKSVSDRLGIKFPLIRY